MNINPYLLFAFIIIVLPCVSVAEQSATSQKSSAEKCVANQKASAERCATSQKASAERCTKLNKESTERCTALNKASSKQSTASQKANADVCTVSQKANAKACEASQKANADACVASQKANADACTASQKANVEKYVTSQKTTSQMAMASEAFKDEGLLKNTRGNLKDELEIGYKIRPEGASATASNPSTGVPLDMVNTLNEYSPMIVQTEITLTQTQKQNIGVTALDLINEPTEKQLQSSTDLVFGAAMGLASRRILIRNAIINEALRQCVGCPSDKVSALKALKK
jgi:hypothetical protein